MNGFLADTIFWIAAAACAVAQIGILRATFRRREPLASFTRRASRVEEIAWAALPACALAVVLVLTYRALHPAGA